eukprot:CAMPEP_0114540954 /NCGR_PEP_ID=MMETSP0114-20121206/1046_2 /TAXON_ID=31324 /ORGANISM="Goniomonas sp, Strain m" /LENGTH=70 /DNA_ID=CAMNT_0001725157 /DNA_START=625 /DNA_END=837 /DNA_ORIENTATION=-
MDGVLSTWCDLLQTKFNRFIGAKGSSCHPQVANAPLQRSNAVFNRIGNQRSKKTLFKKDFKIHPAMYLPE